MVQEYLRVNSRRFPLEVVQYVIVQHSIWEEKMKSTGT